MFATSHFRSILTVAFLMTTAGEAGATDLSGHWRFEPEVGSSATFFEISQTGDAVTITVPFAPYTYTGTLIADTLSVAETVVPLPFGHSIFARMFAGGSAFDGSFGPGSSLLYPTPRDRAMATRCECFDGNAVDGDGCDAHCRIEPCFTCSGDPSTCAPSTDGASCDDRHDCTTGETCSAGTCGGGSTVPACVDMTGRWALETVESVPVFAIEDIRDVVQRDGFLEFRRVSDGGLDEVGTVDPATGTLDLSGRSTTSPNGGYVAELSHSTGWGSGCYDFPFHGTLAASGNNFTGTGTGYLWTSGGPAMTPPYCKAMTFSQTARRCSSGECEVAPNECPPCNVRNGAGDCVPGAHPACLSSVSPSKTKIQITDAEGSIHDRFSFDWMKGANTSAASFGNPVGFDTGMTVCVFDESGATPKLLYQVPVSPHEGWSVDSHGKFSLKKLPVPIAYSMKSVTLTPGTGGKARVSLKGDGLGGPSDPPYTAFPLAPLALPLHVQVQMDNGGACFDAVFGSAGVKKNSAGRFQAAATH